MMWCNNPKCDFNYDDSKEKTPLSCPKCSQSSFSRPKGFDPFRTVCLGAINFPGGSLRMYQTYMDFRRR